MNFYLKVSSFTLSFILISNLNFAQISSIKTAEQKPKDPIAYDSLSNFLEVNYNRYLGQELYLIPKSETLRKYGYEGFLKDPYQSPYDEENVAYCCDGRNSNHEKLQSSYFEVIETIKDPRSEFSGYAFLKLKFKGTEETTYFRYSKEYEHSFPFLVVGYYTKQKQIYSNNEVLIRPFPKIEGLDTRKIIDVETGDEIDLQLGEYVKCLDITIEEKYYETSFLLQRKNGQKFLFPLAAKDYDISRILLKDQAESFRKKFGDENWKTVLEEKIKIGFTEEMTRLSWGDPIEINRSSTSDQWVYDDQYLYFENGKLTAFN